MSSPDHRPHPAAALLTRRAFTAVAAVAAAATTHPAAARARRLADETIVGEGEHAYRVRHQFAKLPDRFTWQTTHGVAVDTAGNLYVIHEGHREQKDHPAIFVFDPAGTFVRAFGSQFQGGGHGIEVRRERNEEFLYVCGYQQSK
ncbi:MAG: peptidase, partial [Planctomycetes bacterium]|nr:peptidase [Planctomycetota bacterium]